MTVDLAQNELEYLIGLISQDFCNKQRETGEPTPFEAGVMRKIYDGRQKMMEEKQAAQPVSKMTEIDDLSELLGKPGESVPVVDVADLKTMWNYGQTLKAEHPEYAEGRMAVGVSVWKEIFAPGVDIRAVGYRFGILGFFEMMLRQAWTLGEPSENALKVAARMELKWAQVGVVRNGFPFNLEGFLAEVMYEAGQR